MIVFELPIFKLLYSGVLMHKKKLQPPSIFEFLMKIFKMFQLVAKNAQKFLCPVGELDNH